MPLQSGERSIGTCRYSDWSRDCSLLLALELEYVSDSRDSISPDWLFLWRLGARPMLIQLERRLSGPLSHRDCEDNLEQNQCLVGFLPYLSSANKDFILHRLKLPCRVFGH